MEWTSVRDGLPDLKERNDRKNPTSDDVLVFNGRISVGCRWKCGDKEYFLSNEDYDSGDITHWMPLPELPKEE